MVLIFKQIICMNLKAEWIIRVDVILYQRRHSHIHYVLIFQLKINASFPRRCCYVSHSPVLGLLSLCFHNEFQRIQVTWLDIAATDNHSQAFTDNEHFVNQGMRLCMRLCMRLWQLCTEAWKYKESVKVMWRRWIDRWNIFYHTMQQLNICIVCNMMFSL